MIRALKFTKGWKSTAREEQRGKKKKQRRREREGEGGGRDENIEAPLGFTRHVTLMKIAEDELWEVAEGWHEVAG